MTNFQLTIEEAADGLRKKEFSSVELTQAYLDRIAKLSRKLNAYLSINSDEALKQARAADKKIASGKTDSPLTGIPVAIKDNMVIRGQKTTAASKILENYIAPYTATAVQKLLDAGAVVLGKTNLDEFAMGSSTENSAFGPTKNPWDETKVPGGSSGGSAAAVAADLCTFALGSDTGGSIRLPASFCGIVGLKPTYGRVSRAGLMAMASSLDQIGPLTKTVKDAAMVLNHLAGFDKKDSTTINRNPEDFTDTLEQGIKGLKIGVPQEYFVEGMDKAVWSRINEAISKFKELGAEIVDVGLPSASYALPTYYVIMPVEVASNLARYDGIKYGLSKQDEAESLLEVYHKSREAGFGREAKRRILIGTYTSSVGYYDAYYKKANAVRELIRQDYQKVFEQVDILVGATSPTPPFKLGEKVDDPLSMYLADVLTVTANLAGIPAVSIPAGLAQALPVGLQLLAPWWEEGKLLRTAYAFEAATGYNKMKPSLEE